MPFPRRRRRRFMQIVSIFRRKRNVILSLNDF